MCKKQKVVVISGPTATGKSALGVELCLRADGEVVSADSMQVYKGMDIGTAKISVPEMRGIPHHMLDVAEPWEDFSVSRWCDMAAECVRDIQSRGKLPVIVGGTGLYIDSLLSGRSFAKASDDGQLRLELSARYDSIGGERFREEVSAVDPERAQRLHAADKKRLVRAMEVFLLTGKTITQHDRESLALPPRFDSVRFALCYADRSALYERIDARVDAMADQGLFQEVSRLMQLDCVSDKCTAMQAIGYKEAASCLRGECSSQDAVLAIKQASRRYAKRQLTWLRRDPELHWISWTGTPDIARAADDILNILGAV